MKRYINDTKYYYLGILGAICFGIGDWLLGYVDTSEVVGEAFRYIRAGHGEGYHQVKAIISMALGTVGLLFYYPALLHMTDIVKDEVKRKRLQYLFGAGAFVWLLIHYFYSVNVFCYAWMMQNGGEALAAELSKALGNAMYLGVAIGYIPLIVPNVMHLIEIMKGRTTLKKSAVCFHPLVWIILVSVLAKKLPMSPFSYGLYTFCMNAGMLVWFMFMSVRKKDKEIGKN